MCEACRASYGALDAENHESDKTNYVLREENPSMHDYIHSCCGGLISKAYHSGGEANCATATICEYCAEEYGSKNPDHHASAEIAYRQDPNDPLSHIRRYACCGVEIGVEAHNGAGSANCYHGDICAICGMEYSEKTGHIYDDANDTRCNVCDKEVVAVKLDAVADNVNANAGNPEAPTDENGGLDTGAIVAISAGSAVVGGTGIFSLVWFVIKKKTWADLLLVLKK